MIVSPAWRGRRYAVLGLARSGAATVRALVAGGAAVTAWDSDPARRADAAGATIADLDTIDLAGFDALVVSPGVPLNTHPLAARARMAEVPIVGDIELFAEARAALPPHKVVGITGTNGKSTTTALVHHILATTGMPTTMGGNIGLPILAQAPLPAGGVYVLELSSYQIDLTATLDCDVAVLLNVTPDHLDRYDGFALYAASKQRLFEMQSHHNVAIIAEDDVEADEVAYRLAHDIGRWQNVVRSHRELVKGQLAWPALQGPHNASNANAAMLVSQALGISDAVIETGLRSFPGLPHRMEHVATLDGVGYVDDSKATNPESAAPALAAFQRIHWIVGGRAKGDDLDACAPFFGHVVRAYTIGEAAETFAAALEGRVAVERAGTLAAAVESARRHAARGETVLLSPAAASFDQFRDYEHRGRAFREAVGALS